MKYENTFKAIDQILWKEQGCGSELDYLVEFFFNEHELDVIVSGFDSIQREVNLAHRCAYQSRCA